MAGGVRHAQARGRGVERGGAEAARGGLVAQVDPLAGGAAGALLLRALLLLQLGLLGRGERVEELARLGAKKKKYQAKLADLEDVRKALGAKKKSYQSKLADAKKLLNTLTAAERAKVEQEERAKEQRASRDAGERIDLGNEAAASGFGAAALSAAATRIGMPYDPGAEGPGSFDCSGLTQWAYGKAGVDLTRTTYTQQNDGVKIGRSQLRPGDLVFFNSLSHVGLYAGNNTILHAPKPGAYVRYESMNYMGTFQFGVRIGG